MQGFILIDLHNFLVLDNNEGIDILFQFFDTLVGLIKTLFPFEVVGVGDDSDGEDTHFAGDLGHHGGGTGTRTLAHTGGDEEHFGFGADQVADSLFALNSQTFGFFRVGACAEAGVPEDKLRGDLVSFDGHFIGIADEEVHAHDTFFIHVLNGIVAGTANAYYFDDRTFFLFAVAGFKTNIF